MKTGNPVVHAQDAGKKKINPRNLIIKSPDDYGVI